MYGIIAENLQSTKWPINAGNIPPEEGHIGNSGHGDTNVRLGEGDPLFNEETSQEGHTLWTKCHHLPGFSSKQPTSSHCPYFHLISVDKASI